MALRSAVVRDRQRRLCTVVVVDRSGRAVVRDRRAIGVAEPYGKRLVGLDVIVVGGRYADRLAGFAGPERQRTARRRIVQR